MWVSDVRRATDIKTKRGLLRRGGWEEILKRRCVRGSSWEGQCIAMRAQSHRAETFRGTSTKTVAEKGNPSEVRSGKASSVGGISKWLRLSGGHKEPTFP